MAKTNNTLLKFASGSIGKDIVLKQYYDKTVISKKPDMSNRVLSEKQKEWNHRMIAANAYAQDIYKSEEEKIKARIRLKLPAHKSLYHALVKEHLVLNKDEEM
jgi:hypothetical protein